MLYHKESNTAFVLVSRAASTSLKKYLLNIGYKYPLVFSPTPRGFYSHPTYADAINQYPNLQQYNTYGVFRDPLDRFVSALISVWRNAVQNPTMLDCDISLCETYDEMVQELFKSNINFKDIPEFVSEVFLPQIDWFSESVKIINYRDVASEVEKITASQNTSGLQFKRSNASPTHSFAAPSDAVRQFVKSKYAADYQFALANSIEVPSA